MFPLKSRLKLMEARKAAHAALESSASAAEAVQCDPSVLQHAAVPNQQELGSMQQGSKYLVVTVIEARNLVAKDYDTHSSDPFVKITLGTVSRKTRAIYRNCHPLWQQKLVYPMEGLSEGEPLLVELFDKDFNSKEFLGQVMMTLGKALEIEADESQRGSYWLVLSKKRSTDIVGGELCLGFEVAVLDPQQYHQTTCDLEALLNAEALASTYSSRALHIQLKGLNGLAASGLFGDCKDKSFDHGQQQQSQQQHLSLFIKYGRVILEKQLPPPVTARTLSEDEPGNSACPDQYEVMVNEEVIIPLAAALRATPLVARKKDELHDIKLYLKSHNTLIAKTQIPITAVPLSCSSGGVSPTGPADDTSCGLVTPAASARVTSEKQHKVQDLDACSISNSLPSTPRGSADFVSAGCAPATPHTNPALDMPVSPMTRSKSDAVCLSALYKHSGGPAGWFGSSSNLSTADTAWPTGANSVARTSLAARSVSPSSQLGLRPAAAQVEGSLDSVTAYSRGHPVHAPAGLHGRRVQGLAEMHESGVGLRKPLKAIFVPPREVKRSGWVPSKVPEEGEEPHSPEAQSRPFCRIMESTLPMYCNIEVNLALAVLEVPKAALTDTTGPELSPGGVQELGEDSIIAEDEEEAPQATPIEPGPPLEVLLQDVTLQGIGVNRLYNLLINAKSDLMKTHNAVNDITNMSVGAWKAAPAGAAYQHVRNVSYVMKLNIPLPLAPERCNVWEEHRLMVKEAGGWVVQNICKNDALKGDCFEAHVQMCGVYVSEQCSRLRVSMQLNWTKNTWGKGMVQGGAESDAKRSYAVLVDRLRQAAGARGSSSPGLKPVTLQGVGNDQGTAAMEVPPATPRWPRGINPGVLLQVALLLALLLVAWSVLSAGRSISAELHQVALAMRECSSNTQSSLGLPTKL